MRNLRLASLLGAVACMSCTTTTNPAAFGSGPSGRASAEYADVMMNMTSWGRPILHWRIHANGTGELWRETRTADGSPGETVEKYRGRLPPERRAEFLRMLDRFRSGAIPRPACPDPIHDAPGVDFRWGAGRGDVVSFYFGCLDASSRDYGRQISLLNGIVSENFVTDPRPYAVERVDTVPTF